MPENQDGRSSFEIVETPQAERDHEYLRHIKKRAGEITKKIVDTNRLGIIYGFKNYTGIGQALGSGTIENSPLAVKQIVMLLALREHQSIQEFINDPNINSSNFNGKRLVSQKPLAGLKVLDLGCGQEKPTFARVARSLGADVYTVDVVTSDKFHQLHMSEEDKLLERTYHIPLDLSQPDSSRKIKDISGGEFDFITAAFLKAGSIGKPPIKVERLAQDLMKEGGVSYQEEGSWDDFCIIHKDNHQRG